MGAEARRPERKLQECPSKWSVLNSEQSLLLLLSNQLEMEPAVGVEPTTLGLRYRCSTTELSRRKEGESTSRPNHCQVRPVPRKRARKCRHVRACIRGPRAAIDARMIIEMRTYKTKPGMRSRFVEIFVTRSVP